MKTTFALFLVFYLGLLAVQANPSGEGGTGAGAGAKGEPGFGNDTGAGSGSDRGSGAGVISGSDGGAGTGADSGSDEGAGAEAGSGSDEGAGAGAGSGSDEGSGDVYSKRLIHVKDHSYLMQMLSEASGKLVMIYFMATWCKPCQITKPQLGKLAYEYAGSIIVLEVDIDEASDVAIDYNVKGVPAFVFVKNSMKLEVSYEANYEKLRTIVLKLK